MSKKSNMIRLPRYVDKMICSLLVSSPFKCSNTNLQQMKDFLSQSKRQPLLNFLCSTQSAPLWEHYDSNAVELMRKTWIEALAKMEKKIEGRNVERLIEFEEIFDLMDVSDRKMSKLRAFWKKNFGESFTKLPNFFCILNYCHCKNKLVLFQFFENFQLQFSKNFFFQGKSVSFVQRERRINGLVGHCFPHCSQMQARAYMDFNF